jgi:hypothetical protein
LVTSDRAVLLGCEVADDPVSVLLHRHMIATRCDNYGPAPG